MANASGHGGYRQPSNPSPVSGPGRLSKRTDKGQPVRVAPGGDYGDRQDMVALQQAAPLAQTPPPQATPPAPIDTSSLTPLHAPTEQPGVGLLDNLGQFSQPPSPSSMDPKTRAKMLTYLPTLLWLASQPEASEQTRQFIRQLRSDL